LALSEGADVAAGSQWVVMPSLPSSDYDAYNGEFAKTVTKLEMMATKFKNYIQNCTLLSLEEKNRQLIHGAGEEDCGLRSMSDDKTKPEIPASINPHSKVCDEMDDTT
jgi:hypothetical protein